MRHVKVRTMTQARSAAIKRLVAVALEERHAALGMV